MSALLLVCRLTARNLRRRPVGAVLFLLAITTAATTLTMGLTVNRSPGILYAKTKAATAGPDITVTSTTEATDLSALARVEHGTGLAAHSGPFAVYHTTLRSEGRTMRVSVEAREPSPSAVDRPLVTSGQWVRPGGAVLDRGFAAAIGVHVGGRVAVNGHSYPVVGLAVTAATDIYPGQEIVAFGPGDDSGLIWLAPADARAVAAGQPPDAYVLDLRLTDPDASAAFADTYVGRPFPANHATWQFIGSRNDVLIRGITPTLLVGGWLLAVEALVGVAALVALRGAAQNRRVGPLKAVGATPGLVAGVLLAEYLLLAATGACVGLLAGTFAAPLLDDPSSDLLEAVIQPAPSTIVAVAVLAAAVPLLATLGPTVRAARTGTVDALADAAHVPAFPAPFATFSARLPVPLMLGVRLLVGRPRRAILGCAGAAAVGMIITALATFRLNLGLGNGTTDDLGGLILPDPAVAGDSRVMTGVSVAMALLAAVNMIVLTWSTAAEARRYLAIARTLGATPGQVTAGLCVAQLLPAVPGILIGAPTGLALYWVFAPGIVLAAGALVVPLLAVLIALGALAALPAWIQAHRPPAAALSAETP